MSNGWQASSHHLKVVGFRPRQTEDFFMNAPVLRLRSLQSYVPLRMNSSESVPKNITII